MFCIRRVIAAIIVLGIIATAAVRAETIALIGTGEVSGAFGPRFASLGHQVIFGSRTPDSEDAQALVRATGHGASAMLPHEAAAEADIVMVNVPWNVAEQVVLGLGDLTGKIIIDPTNPRRIDENGFRDYPSHTANAEILQNAAPTAFVVKAINTISTAEMIHPDSLAFKITIPIAGNDAAAKKKVAGLIEDLGYAPVDVGPVQFAHVVEGLYLLRANSRDKLGTHFDYRFTVRDTAAVQDIR